MASDERSTDDRIRAHIRKLVRTRFGSTYKVAQKIGVDPSTFYKILSGDRGIGTETLKALHKGLGVSADVFLDDDPEEEYWHALADESRRGRRPREDLEHTGGAIVAETVTPYAAAASAATHQTEAVRRELDGLDPRELAQISRTVRRIRHARPAKSKRSG